MRRMGLMVVLVGLSVLSARAQQSREADDPHIFYVMCGSLFDGKSDSPQRDVTIITGAHRRPARM